MRARCPSARLIERAKLPSHRLAFGGNSARWQGAVATVVPDSTRDVWGVIYEMGEEDLASLDRHEGAPVVYERHRLRCVVPRAGIRSAWVYQLVTGMCDAPVNPRYASQLRRGYQEHGLDEFELDRALDGHRTMVRELESLWLPGLAGA